MRLPDSEKERRRDMRRTLSWLLVALLGVGAVCGWLAWADDKEGTEQEKGKKEGDINQQSNATESWTESFDIEASKLASKGKNKYFILEPGYKLILEDTEGKSKTKLVITVLNETKKIGDVETRIVEERETVDGDLAEISRNFYAVDTQTNSIFYFGEEVDIYENGKVVDHSGSWQAGSNDAKAGLMMPGIILLGARYYQEMAPNIAMDRAEIVSHTEELQTPAGAFKNCLKTEETTALKPQGKEYKLYAPGIGLIKDENLLLTKYGVIKE
jgi:hypothetical protein